MNNFFLFLAIIAVVIIIWVCAYRFVSDNRVISKIIIKNNTSYSDTYVLQAVYRFLLNPRDKRVTALHFEIEETTFRPDSNVREFTVVEK